MAGPVSTQPMPQRLAAIREQLALLADYLDPAGLRSTIAELEARILFVRAEPHGFVCLSADTLATDPDLRPIGVRRLLILLRRLALRTLLAARAPLYAEVATVTGGTAYADTGLVNDRDHAYTLVAVDGHGNRSVASAPAVSAMSTARRSPISSVTGSWRP